MTQVVYEGPTGRRNPLRTQLAYQIGKHVLPVGEPVDLPDDVAQQLLDQGHKGHRFRAGDGDEQTAASGGGDEATAPDTGGSPVEGGAGPRDGDDAATETPADEPVAAATTTTRGRRGA